MSWIDDILNRSGDPDLAFRQWEDLRRETAGFEKLPGARTLLHLLGNSRAFVSPLIQEPRQAAEIARSRWLSEAPDLRRRQMDLRILFERSFTGEVESALPLLRRYKIREMIRIAARDLAGLSFEETGRELTLLAEALTEFAVRGSGLSGHFTVMGLGKLGAWDLNVSSDVDLLYLYDSDSKDREFFTNGATKVTRLLQERTGEGIVYRVDLGLRPEGKSGALVQPVEALLSYYEVLAAPWEHAALLRARPVAGDLPLGRRFVESIHPLLYHRYKDASVVRNIRQIKEKIRNELVAGGFHVKLGDGGIREIEFFAQAFQLLYGGGEPALRETSTLAVLQGIEKLSVVPGPDLEGLRESYIFLRRIENHLQRLDDQQVHRIPSDTREALALSRRMGFSGPDEFTENLNKRTEHVRRCFEELLPD